jgi:D-alanyl-D-alanine carboxypeptidase
MQSNAQKILFLAVVLAAVVVSWVVRPSLFVSGGAQGPAAANGSAEAAQAANTPPMLVLPSLSADIGAQGPVAAPTSTAPDVGASAELIADLMTGRVYLSVNADGRWPLASVSKLMTAAVAEDVLSQNQYITITASMLAADPTQQILHLGDTYTVADLLHILLLPSNNVAAEALAQFYGRPQFLAAMNAKAQAWGMTSTYYDDPSGLSAANQSSATDLLKLAQHIYADYPEILAITRTPQVTARNLSTGQDVIIKSINQFAGDADFVGGKTGYTDQADGNLLSIFQYDGRPVFVVVLGVNDGVRFDATQELYNWFKANFK